MEDAGTLILEVCEEQYHKGEAFSLVMNYLGCSLPALHPYHKKSQFQLIGIICLLVSSKPHKTTHTSSSSSLSVVEVEVMGFGEGSSNRTWLLQLHLISWPCFYKTLPSD